ncbi:carbohydrate sulfotransferase 3 isoform X2 [Penaeus vannamei]|uniref:carbohydrate sulfotransferase 3 isoform X2 n=1 Tax=Penaeus vannamei TaxID=6689 RepID=UPI00387F6173
MCDLKEDSPQATEKPLEDKPVADNESERLKNTNPTDDTKARAEESAQEPKQLSEDARSTCSNSSSDTSSSASSSDASTTSTSSGGPSDATEGEPSRVIKIEDSGRQFDVVEPTKPKTWFAAFNSLAPRTRQTVRTAVIALVSALALVAIFHLAKLAEHPVSQKESTGAGGDERGGDGLEQPAVPVAHMNLAHSPVQDMLARARNRAGGAMHPLLGVPMSPEIEEWEIKRLNRLDRSRARPANATEIKRTLSLVQTRVDTDRKALVSKDLRLWAPGEAPLRILLVTTWRSGSTFLGQVLAHHPAVFQHYEPLSPQGIKQIRSGREAIQAQQLLHRLLDCRYEGMADYLNYTRAHPEDMLGHNKIVWDSCRHGPNTNACYNATFLTQACQMFPIQLVKTVRLRLNLTQLFLNDERMNLKVVFLVRDPRATMSSRYSSVSWCTDKPDCSSPEVLCSDLEGDLKVATALRQLYPDSFTMLKYEDLASDPQEEIHKLMDFLGLEFSPEIAQYVKETTEKDDNSPWSTKRKSSDRISLWKKQLPLQEIHTIQNACESVIKTLGYEMAGQ